jgi:hypothetical protein
MNRPAIMDCSSVRSLTRQKPVGIAGSAGLALKMKYPITPALQDNFGHERLLGKSSRSSNAEDHGNGYPKHANADLLVK